MNKYVIGIFVCFALVAGLCLKLLSEKTALSLANEVLVRSLSMKCYSTVVGEVVALSVVDGELQCLRRYEGLPNAIWQRKSSKTKS